MFPVPLRPRPPRLRPLRSAAARALALAVLGFALRAPCAAFAASPADSPPAAVLELRGRVVIEDGTPLAHARMTLRVTRAATTTCDDSGRFRVSLRLPAVETLERGPWIAQLDGTAREWRLMYSDGEPSLGLELALDRAAGGMRVVARSNDERLAATAAAAVARSEKRTLDGVRFVAIGGERSSLPPAPNLTHVAAVVIESRAGSETPPATNGAESPRARAARADSAGRASAARVDSARRAAAPPRPVRAPRPAPRPRRPAGAQDAGPAAAHDSLGVALPAAGDRPPSGEPAARPAPGDERVHPVDPTPALGPTSPPVVPRGNAPPPPPPGPLVNPRRSDAMPDPHGCACRFAGTVELVRSTVLTEPEQIVIRLEEWPAVADTVELYMGAPRPFRLAPVPCGSRRLTVERLDPLLPAVRVVTGQAMRGFGCASGELVQPRLVIALDRGRRRR